jgi:hypothetical protein
MFHADSGNYILCVRKQFPSAFTHPTNHTMAIPNHFRQLSFSNGYQLRANAFVFHELMQLSINFSLISMRKAWFPIFNEHRTNTLPRFIFHLFPGWVPIISLSIYNIQNPNARKSKIIF